MNVTRKHLLELLFEHARVRLATMELEELIHPDVLFVQDICIHGTNVFDIVLDILGIEAKSEERYEYLYNPFTQIFLGEFGDTKGLHKKIEEYYEWLILQK